MANTFAVSRNHLIFGLCLPLAMLLGYLLAEPLESSSLVGHGPGPNRPMLDSPGS